MNCVGYCYNYVRRCFSTIYLDVKVLGVILGYSRNRADCVWDNNNGRQEGETWRQ